MNARASILIAAVWVLVFFTLLATAFYSLFSGRLNLVAYLKERPLAEQAAYSAVELARFEEAIDPDYADSLKEFNASRSKELGQASFECALTDEQSRININYAEAAVLARLPEMDMDKAAAISACRFRPFESIEELRMIDGIGPDVFTAIEKYITVYGGRMVNINTAPEEVLKALGMDPGLLEKIMRFRQGDDQEAATADDNVFNDRTAIIADLEKTAVLGLREKALLTNLVGLGVVGVSSQACTLDVAVRVNAKAAGKYRIVLDGQGIRRWQEK